MSIQYWDLELKNQSKKRMQLVNEAIAEFGVIIHRKYEEKIFEGKQAWRNPLWLKISLPSGTVNKFKSKIKGIACINKPPVVSINPSLVSSSKPIIENQINHTRVRTYCLHGYPEAYIKDYKTGVMLEGIENVLKVLDGNLGLIKNA